MASNTDTYTNKNIAVLENCETIDNINKNQVCSKDESWWFTNTDENYSNNQRKSNNMYGNKDYGIVSNIRGFTIGDTNTGLHCTTVHSVQKCQVSARFYNNEILDHAAIYTNMISDGEPFDYCSLLGVKQQVYTMKVNTMIILKILTSLLHCKSKVPIVIQYAVLRSGSRLMMNGRKVVQTEIRVTRMLR